MRKEILVFLTFFGLFIAATIGTTKWEQHSYQKTFQQRLAKKMESKTFAQKWHKMESFDQVGNFLLTPYNLKREKEKRLKVKVQKAVNL